MKKESIKEFISAQKEIVNEFMNRSHREEVIEDQSDLEDFGFLFLITPTHGLGVEPIPNL